MKKIVALATFTAVATAATLSFAGMAARTGVNGSFHDMNAYNAVGQGHGTQDNYNRVCVFCHTPHNAIVADTNTNPLPLWGNDLTVVEQPAYQWATPENFNNLTVTDALIGPSRLCMSCHDGSIAVDAHISNEAKTGTYTLQNERAIGNPNASPLAKTHPIGFDYIVAKQKRNITNVVGQTAQDEIVDETKSFATKITIHNTQAEGYNEVERNGNRSIKSVLYDGKWMTCASCHEVHNKENALQDVSVDGTKTPNYFLYAKEKESLICLSCHVK